MTAPAVPSAAAESDSSAGSPVVPVNLGGTAEAGYPRSDGQAYTGAGQFVVVIDGAFNPDHPALAGKVAHEACFGRNIIGYDPLRSGCSRSADNYLVDGRLHWFEAGAGASRPNPECVEADGALCHVFHGTAVASAAAGNKVSPGGGLPVVSGAAVDAQLILIKVGRKGGWEPESVGAALHYVRTSLAVDPKYQGRIAAVNISAANDGTLITDGNPCINFPYLDGETEKLKAAGIPVVVAAGNTGTPNAIGSWACKPSVVAVGSSGVADMDSFTTGDFATVASERIKLLAPVGSAPSPQDGVWLANNYATATTSIMSWNQGFRGTSFAAPQVAGAFAVLRQQYGPGPTVDELTSILQTAGKPVTDMRSGTPGAVIPRLWLTEELAPRDAGRSVWDFTGDASPEYPVLEADGVTLNLYSAASTGVVSAGGAKTTVSASWSGHSVTAPVYDFQRPGGNGFLTATGKNVLYHHYNPDTATLDPGAVVLTGGGDQIVGMAFTHKWDGTNAAVVIQKTNGQIVLRPTDNTGMLGPERELVAASTGKGLVLVGIADINNDALPDLIVRAPTHLKPEAYLATSATGFASSRFIIDAATKWSTWATFTQVSVLEDWVEHQPRLSYQLKTGGLWHVSLKPNGTINATHNSTAWPTTTRHLHSPQARDVPLAPRDAGRSVWDFTGDASPEYPVLEADGVTLNLYSAASTGVVSAGGAKTTVSASWSGHSVTAPVYDFQRPGGNGFLTATGKNVLYHHYNPDTATLDPGAVVLTGGGDQIVGMAFTHKWDGTNAAVVIQKTNGQIVLRPTDNTGMLGPERELVAASTGKGLVLVGIADINNDALPDLIVRAPTHLKPEAYLATSATGFASSRFIIDAATKWSTWATFTQVSVLEDWVEHQPRLSYQLKTGGLWHVSLKPNGTINATHNSTAWPTTTRHLHSPQVSTAP
ncbi:S8 family peptidase [Microbacterium sp. NPDC055665]